jgi:toxin HigB-1
VILSFKCTETERLYNDQPVKRFESIERVARRKLLMLASAKRLDDLRSPPGNRLEALKADRQGQFSIRVNERYRVCFVWEREGPEEVEIVDYH